MQHLALTQQQDKLSQAGSNEQQGDFSKSHWPSSNDGVHAFMRNLLGYRSTYPRHRIMDIQKHNPSKEKIVAERINGAAAVIGCIALVGAYITTGQIIPGFV